MILSNLTFIQKTNSKVKRVFLYTALPLAVLFVCVFSSQTFAAYGAMPTELLTNYSNHISVNANEGSTGEGLKSQQLLIAVYRNDNSGPVDVYFDSGSCSDYSFAQVAFSNDNDDTPGVGTPIDADGNCSGSHVTVTTFADSQKFKSQPPDNDPNDNKDVAILRIEINASSITKSPKFEVRSGGQRLGYLGYPYTYTPNSTQEFRYGPALSYDGGRSSITIQFAPPCDFSGPKNFYWRDADSNKDANKSPEDPTEPVTYRIFDDTDSDYSMDSAQDAGDETGANGVSYYFRKGHKYHISFYNVKGGDYGDAKANSIQVFYPFSSAGYFNDCDFPVSGWQVTWASNYVRQGGLDRGQTVGSLSDPGDGQAPQPGQYFEYINDARNSGAREITDLRWSKVCVRTSDSGNGKCYNPAGGAGDRWWSDSYKLVNSSYSNQLNYNDYDNNTQTIAFDRGRTGQADDTFSNRGTGVAAGKYVGGPGWVWDAFSVTKEDGGRTHCVNASFWPNQGNPVKTSGVGTTDWVVPGVESRVYAPQLCVNVPYHYKLSSEMTTHPVSMTQQGDGVTVAGQVTNPLTTNGRNNTNSHSTLAKGIVEFQLPAGVAEPVVGADASNGLAPCAWVTNKAPAAQACDDTKGRQLAAVEAGGTLSLSYTRPALDTIHLGVGTKLCYAIYVQHPQNLTSTDAANLAGPYSYTSIDCTVIVKSPKVQFENGDLTVGRHWIDGKTHTNGSACDDIVGTASITASGAPDVVRDDTTGTYSPKELYGSWVEYGAFARGSISGMGTGSRPFGLGVDTVNGAKRLMFSNTVTGGFNYGVTCLNNPFENIKTSDSTQVTNLASLPAIPAKPPVFENGNLRINELAELYDNSYDKTGYVSKGKDIKVTPRPKDNYSVRVKVNASGQSGNDVPNGPMSTPKMRISVGDDSGVYSDKTVDVTSVYPAKTEYQETFNLGDAGYKGPQDVSGSNPVIDIDFVNNNDNDAWRADSSNMTDRNLYLGDITVEWLKNGNPIHASGPFAPASLSKDSHDYYTGNPGAPCPTQTANASGLLPILSSTGDNGYQLGYCHGVHIYQNQLGITPEPTPPSILSDDYPNFGGDGTHEGRDIVLYAQLNDPTKSCSDPANDGSGNLFIDQDIVYKRYGYSKLTEMPRVVFVADCDITIADDVTKVYASLIAGDAIKTCSVKALTIADCGKSLYISGAVSANRLLLWRTYGADLTSAGAAQTPAEDFSMSPTQMVTGYTRGNGTPNPTVAHEVDLPPRY